MSSPDTAERRGSASLGVGGSASAALRIEELTKSYVKGRQALAGVSFEIEKGEFVSILGPSGCGKTTLLRCVAGLEDVDGGSIELAGSVVSARGRTVPPYRRKIGMVFQSYALWPHMTVAQNVAYPLKSAGVGKAERAPQVSRVLELLDIGRHQDAYPFQLSGGQQQRVALARALVGNPQLVLFDEPLSNLDARLRESVKLLIRSIAKEIGFTALYVTHDRSEAIMISDRVVLMRDGQVVQIDPPVQMFQRPNSRFSANFLGEANFFSGQVVEQTTADRIVVELPGGVRLEGSADVEPRPAVGERADVMIRFGSVEVTGAGGSKTAANTHRMTVYDAIFGGETWRYVGALLDAAGQPAGELTFLSTAQIAAADDVITVHFPPRDIRVFPAESTEAARG